MGNTFDTFNNDVPSQSVAEVAVATPQQVVEGSATQFSSDELLNINTRLGMGLAGSFGNQIDSAKMASAFFGNDTEKIANIRAAIVAIQARLRHVCTQASQLEDDIAKLQMQINSLC